MLAMLVCHKKVSLQHFINLSKLDVVMAWMSVGRGDGEDVWIPGDGAQAIWPHPPSSHCLSVSRTASCRIRHTLLDPHVHIMHQTT